MNNNILCLCDDILELVVDEVKKIRKIKKNYLNVLKSVENIENKIYSFSGCKEVSKIIEQNMTRNFHLTFYNNRIDDIEIDAYKHHEDAKTKKCIEENEIFQKIHLHYIRYKHGIYNKNYHLKMFDTEERLNKKTLYIFNDYGYSDDLQYNQIINYKHLIREFNNFFVILKNRLFYGC